jgi:hypothetical protein
MQVLVFTLDNVGHHQRAFIQLDPGDVIGDFPFKGRMVELMVNAEGVDLSLAADLDPGQSVAWL